MPMSNVFHLPAVIQFVCAIQPHRILDVGVGMGAYGFLLRQYLEISRGRLRKCDWKVIIEGVEIFEGYRNPIWDYAYDRILIGDIRVLIRDLGRYDVVMCNDILEHLERKEARFLMEQLLERSAVVIATTPNREFPQGIRGENEAERHICLLDASDFRHLVVKMITGITSIYVCSLDKSMQSVLRETAISCPAFHCRNMAVLMWQAKAKLRRIIWLALRKRN